MIGITLLASLAIGITIVAIAMFQNTMIALLSGAPIGFAVAVLTGWIVQNTDMYWDMTISRTITVLSIVAAYMLLRYARRSGVAFSDIRRTLDATHRRRSVRRSVRSQAKSIDFKFEVER